MAEEQGKENGTEVEDDDIYTEPKSRPKIVRILTVFAYMSSVSMAAILLSVYYIFMWDGQPTLARRRDPHMEPMVAYPPRDVYHDYHKIHEDTLTKSVEKSLGYVLKEDETNTSTKNHSLTPLKMVQEELGQHGNVSEGITMQDDSFSTLNSIYATTEEQPTDHGTPKETANQFAKQEEAIEPTFESSFDVSSPNPSQDREEPEPAANKGILSNQDRFFYSKLMLA